MPRVVGLVLLCLLTFVIGLGKSAITDSDEAYYAEAGREMVATGDWTTPHYNYEPRLQKPILFYWLIAATYSIVGVSEWAARLWSGLAGMGLALVAAVVARRWCRPAPGWLPGAIVATSFGVVPLARQALPDMLLAFLVSVTIWTAIEAFSVVKSDERVGLAPQQWLYISAVAMALGMLTKGPVAVALPVTVLVPLVAWEWRQKGVRRVPFALRASHLVVAGALFVLVAAPWYLAVIRAQGIDYARQFFIGENVERFATSTYNTWRGWQYVPIIVAGLLPWSAFFLLWIRPVVDWLKGRRPMTPVEARLIAWAAGPLVFFLISVGSQPRYILPCLVPLSILLGRSIWTEVTNANASRRRDRFGWASVTAGILIVLLGVLLWRAERILTAPAGAPGSIGPALMIGIGLAVTLALFVMPRRAVPLALTTASAAALVAFQLLVLAPGRPEPVETIAAAVRAQMPVAGLCACGAFARSLVYYAHAKTEIANVTADDTSQLEAFLEQPERVLAAVDSQALAKVEAARGRRFPRIAEVRYLNTNVWQRGDVLLRADSGRTQNVLLIANR